MKKICLLLCVAFFLGCEAPNSITSQIDDKEPQSQNTQILDGTQNCVDSYYLAEIEPRVQACKVCHINGGAAESSSSLILSDDKILNQSTLLEFMLENQKRLIQKNTAVLEHQGGASFDDKDVLAFENFKSYGSNAPLCKLPSNVVLASLSPAQISLLDYKSTAKKVISKVYHRDANESELQDIVSRAELNSYLDVMMQDDKFYDYLMFEFNDIFQIDSYLGNSTAGIPTDVYRWMEHYKDENISKWNYLKRGTNYGAVRQSLELIAHVVKNERSLDEILTADYILVNPFSGISWDVNNSEFYDQSKYENFFYDGSDNYEAYSWYDFKEAKIHIHGTAKRRLQDIEYYPHAGILNDFYFLKKYPTSGTNRNRHRAKKIAEFFWNVDIEAIAIRSTGDLGIDNNYTNPTTQNPNCTVCHYVMDPIAGAYQNFYGVIGSQFYLPRFDGWFDIDEKDMFAIGYSMIDVMPDEFRPNSLQWLASKIVKDPRFVHTMLRHFSKMLLGHELLTHPSANDEKYNELLQAYELQEEIVAGIIEKFENSNRNTKVLIKEIIFSALFRAKSVDQSSLELDRLLLNSHLLTPEALSDKLNTKMPTLKPSDFNTYSQWRYIDTIYNLLYGGIDNKLENRRDHGMNAIKAGIQKRISFDAGCKELSFDLLYSKGTLSEKRLTPFVDVNTTPESAEDIAKIKQNIQYLHKYLRNEEMSLDSEELNFTYTLLKESYEDFKAQGRTRIINCSGSFNYQGVYTGNEFDRTFMVQTWSVIINYLVDDFYFFYDIPQEEK